MILPNLKKLTLLLALTLPLNALAGTPATLYKNPNCGCCQEYAKYLEALGFDVKVIPTYNLPLIQREHHVPQALEGCHTTLIDNYVIEGHVPVESIQKLLKQQPKIIGISVPGMPAGSPAMSGTKTGPLTIYQFSPSGTQIYATQ